jgi:hypothetical protein
MAMILLAIYLIARGLTGLFAQFNTATVNLVINIIAIIAGVLMLLGR